MIKGRDEEKFDTVFNQILTTTVKNDNTDFFIHETKVKKIIIPFHEIMYFEIYRRVILIHLDKDETLQIYKSINDLEDEVSEKGFIRVHRSFLVNIQYVMNIQNQTVFLKSNLSLPIGRKYHQLLRETLNLYLTRGE